MNKEVSLRWEVSMNGDYHSIELGYTITRLGDGGFLAYDYKGRKINPTMELIDTLDNAKVVCQLDFEAEIANCVEFKGED